MSHRHRGQAPSHIWICCVVKSGLPALNIGAWPIMQNHPL
ncbi:hypothetical protein C4J98_2599 [Pseudomonas orientalis]|nr:hypothetical protein C4J98_2599 [Pseudomonas orientalis]